MTNDFITSAKNQFEYYKLLGEKTFSQLTEEQLFWNYNDESNSIATIVKHLSGNMLSRWTDFFTTDGEKEWRNRDSEFDNDIKDKNDLIEQWNTGWKIFFNVIENLKVDDLDKIIYIRNQGHSVTEAINRQLAHYPYHIGQIVFIGKMVCDDKWNSLSIPKGKSTIYNQEKFEQPKEKRHFTKEFIDSKQQQK